LAGRRGQLGERGLETFTEEDADTRFSCSRGLQEDSTNRTEEADVPLTQFLKEVLDYMVD